MNAQQAIEISAEAIRSLEIDTSIPHMDKVITRLATAALSAQRSAYLEQDDIQDSPIDYSVRNVRAIKAELERVGYRVTLSGTLTYHPTIKVEW